MGRLRRLGSSGDVTETQVRDGSAIEPISDLKNSAAGGQLLNIRTAIAKGRDGQSEVEFKEFSPLDQPFDRKDKRQFETSPIAAKVRVRESADISPNTLRRNKEQHSGLEGHNEGNQAHRLDQIEATMKPALVKMNDERLTRQIKQI